MSRLTTRTEDGRAALKLDNPKTEEEARNQLHDKFLLAVEKLARWEDLEEIDPETGLKPCPFCGSKWTQVKYSHNPGDTAHVYDGFEAYCDDCVCKTKRFNTPDEAIAAWNRRAGE